jgi:hypothetical protein
MNAINVPVTITPEAAARVAELGFHAELEQMFENARQLVPDLRRIEVELNVRYDEEGPDGILLTAISGAAWTPDDAVWKRVSRRQVDTFPPEVLEHMHLTVRQPG